MPQITFSPTVEHSLRVMKRSGDLVLCDSDKIRASIVRAAKRRSLVIDVEFVLDEVTKNIYDKAPTADVEKALIMAAVSFIERDPTYDDLAAQLLLQKSYKEVFGISVVQDLMAQYRTAFIESIHKGVEYGVLDKRMIDFDLEALAQGLSIERDTYLNYLGLQTLHDRYFLKFEKKCYELPQTFWMRTAMGLALVEKEKEKYAREFYDVLSTLQYVSSTPTLFHAGFKTAQLSSCYLTTINDDLTHIFKCMGDNAAVVKMGRRYW